MEFLPSTSCDSTTVRMHFMDADNTYWEKAKPEPHKNITIFMELILEGKAISHETTAVQSLISHL